MNFSTVKKNYRISYVKKKRLDTKKVLILSDSNNVSISFRDLKLSQINRVNYPLEPNSVNGLVNFNTCFKNV